MAKKETRLGEQHQWDLAKQHLARAQQAADYLRALLFTASGAAIGFVASGDEIETSQLISIFAFALAIASIVLSWDIQKGKSLTRYKTLRDKTYSDYLTLEKKYEIESRNYVIDRWTYAFITLGFAAAIFDHLCTN